MSNQTKQCPFAVEFEETEHPYGKKLTRRIQKECGDWCSLYSNDPVKQEAGCFISLAFPAPSIGDRRKK